jgi:hypothetical protein
MNEPTRPLLEPIILDFNDTDYPPEPIVQLPMEERFRDRPTRSLLDYLEMGVLVPEAEAAVRAELARRGVPPPTA